VRVILFTDRLQRDKGQISIASYLNGYLAKFQHELDERSLSEFEFTDSAVTALLELVSGFDIVGYSIWSTTVIQDHLRLFRELKRRLGISTVAGGPALCELHRNGELGELLSVFDSVVVGAGEYRLKDIADGQPAGGLYVEERVSPLVFKPTEYVRATLAQTASANSLISIPIRTFDGCYKPTCYFCTFNRSYLGGPRKLSPDDAIRIVEGMNGMARSLSQIEPSAASKLYFSMSHASISEPNLRTLLECLAARRAGEYTWLSFLRVEPWAAKYLTEVERLGGMVDVGFEILSARDVVNKKVARDDAIRFAFACHRAGVRLWSTFMYGLPRTGTSDLISSAIGLARIRHTLFYVVLNQYFLETGSMYERHPARFGIKLCDPSSQGFCGYSGFKRSRAHGEWVRTNKSYAQAVAGILQMSVDSYSRPIRGFISLPKLGASETADLISRFFPSESRMIEAEVTRTWELSE